MPPALKVTVASEDGAITTRAGANPDTDEDSLDETVSELARVETEHTRVQLATKDDSGAAAQRECTGNVSAAETGNASIAETRNASAAETGNASITETRHASAAENGNSSAGKTRNASAPETRNAGAAHQDAEDSTDTAPDDQDTLEVDETEVDVDKAPDGGWGWLIIIGIISTRCLIGAFVRARGILFVKFKERFHESATSIAMLTSLAAFSRLMLGPLVSILTNRFSCRSLTAVGVIIVAASYIIAGYAPNLGVLYVSYGALNGLGRAFVLTPIPILLGSYFDKRRSLAFGLASSGFSIGGFALTPVVEILFQTYGYQGAFLILGGFGFQILVFACLFRPIELHRKLTTKPKRDTPEQVLLRSIESLHPDEDTTSVVIHEAKQGPDVTHRITSYSKDQSHAREQTQTLLKHQSKQNKRNDIGRRKPSGANSDTGRRKSSSANSDTGRRKSSSANNDKKTAKTKKLIDLSILKDVRYLCYVFATMCFTLPSPGLFLPSLAKDRGLSDIQAASLLSAQAGVDAVFRIISGFVLDMKVFRNIRPEIFNGITFCQSITILLFPSMRTYAHFFALTAIQGSLMGIKNAQGSVIVMDMLGVDKLASSLAVTMTAQGISVFIGPTISGQLTDISGSYDGTFYFGACAVFVGACIMAFGQIRKRYLDRVAKTKNKNFDSELNETP